MRKFALYLFRNEQHMSKFRSTTKVKRVQSHLLEKHFNTGDRFRVKYAYFQSCNCRSKLTGEMMKN